MHAVARHNADVGKMAVLHRGVVGTEHDIVEKRELRMDEERSVDSRDDRNLQIEQGKGFLGLIEVKNVIAVLVTKLSAKAIAIPARVVEGGKKAVAGTGEDDALVLRVVVNISESRNERAMQFEVPATWASFAVHPHFENSPVSLEREELLPLLSIVIEVSAVELISLERFSHRIAPFRRACQLEKGR